MLVLVQDAAETVTSMDVQVGDPVWVSDRFGQRCEWAGVDYALMRAMLVVEDFVLA